MKAPTFLLLFSLSFFIDQLAGVLFPGRLLAMMVFLFVAVLFDKKLLDHLGIFTLSTLIVDLFSGFSFGLLTMFFLAFALAIAVLRKWVRI